MSDNKTAVNLVSMTGGKVHAPAGKAQVTTWQFACAPMGVNAVGGFHSFRWTSADVTCKRCIKAQTKRGE